jgi:uncharacterized membrane protein YgcG/predicted small lipoprotein YifL
MKRSIAFLLAVALVLSMAACGKKTEPDQTVAETAETETAPVETTEETIPAPTEPEWEPGIARAGYGEVLHNTLAKGTEVNVLGQFKHYYVLEGEELDVLVEQRFVRLNSEEAFASWTGYAKWNTEVYDNVYMRGESIAKLNTNKKVEVLEGKDNWLYIRWDDQEGYVELSNIRKYPYKSGSSDEGGGGGGGSSGGPVDGTGFSFNDLSAWNEGWEVTLLGNYYGPEMETPEEADVSPASGTACVIADNVETYMALLQRGDTVKVTEKTEEAVTIWLGDEFFGKIPGWLVVEEGAAEYESWTGYARWNGILYEEYQMRNEITKPGTNAAVTVLDELPDCYVVEYKGQTGYMKLDGLGKYRVSTGGGSDSSGDGGGSSGGGGSGGAVWTPPAL